jgi:hypothetical protein
VAGTAAGPKFSVQGDEAPLLLNTPFDQLAIRKTLEPLLRHRYDVEARIDQHRSGPAGEVLVELEPHAGFDIGMSTYRSRLISAP